MPSLQVLEVLALVGIFVVRFGVPLLLSAAVVWWLHRLDARWSKVTPAVTEIPDDAPAEASTGHAQIIGEPCWVYRACPEERRSQCPAYLTPEVACWLARLRCDGRLTSNCRCCSVFATSHVNTTAAAD